MGAQFKCPDDTGGVSVRCGCSREKIQAVHAWLKESFPQFGLRHFHAPTRLMQAGLPLPHAEHHVISVIRDDVLPYYLVLLGEFLEQPLDAVCEHLRNWDVANTLRALRIAIVSKEGASPL
jgi:hypothetical protein